MNAALPFPTLSFPPPGTSTLAAAEHVAAVSCGVQAGARHCAACGGELHARRPDAIYCSGRCRLQAHRQRRDAELAARLALAEQAVAGAMAALMALRTATGINTDAGVQS